MQAYVDHHRKSHYLEGATGEYIMPNWTTWSRESLLYADIVSHEDGEPVWNAPEAHTPLFDFGKPHSWHVCEALRNMGVFTRAGLDIVSTIWGQTTFIDMQGWEDAEKLTHQMLTALDDGGLIADQAHKDQLGVLYDGWQFPMYNIDFKRTDVPLEDLQTERDAVLWSEAGY